MLAVLSPAKTLDLESPLPTRRHSQPRLLDEAVALAEVMAGQDAAELRRLMGISEELALTNVERWRTFTPEHTPATARPAALTFDGPVYRGLDAGHRFDARGWTRAQRTVRILSGLYGVLRPLDLIEAHRLEMGTRLATERGATLVQWWGARPTDLLAEDLAQSPGPPVVVNLASAEYWSVVDEERLGARVVTPRFEDRDRSGRWRVVVVHAKRARGRMAGWLATHPVRSVKALTAFDEGYRHVPDLSTPDEPVFRAVG